MIRVSCIFTQFESYEMLGNGGDQGGGVGVGGGGGERHRLSI